MSLKETKVADESSKPKKWAVILLFTSFSTLICCALPVLLVSIGLGSVAAAIYGNYFPFLQWFGYNAGLTFGVTALILIIAGWFLFRPARTCPVDPVLAAACISAHKWNIRFYWGAVVIWLIGMITAFILPILI